jgi:solute:Na+ symporter, SSS family
MATLDWVVLIGTVVFITVYGIWRGRASSTSTKDYLLSKKMGWATIGLSIMATQASAITFLSTPGQAYTDGLRFVQFYFGLPLAMIVLSVTFVPIFHKLNVYTAYEFLEARFDLKTRSLTAFLFLVQRGLAAGLTIFAPALILSVVLGWDLFYTNLALGGLVVLYTVLGGTTAVSVTQKQQMFIILVGMATAAYMVLHFMPPQVGFGEAIKVAGKMGKLNAITLDFDWNDRYNLWSGLIGGFFLSMSYFGTDQSQVQRYLGGKSIAESRLGLLFNGFIKIPMQLLILLIGVLVYVFYLFQTPPVFFNPSEVDRVYRSPHRDQFLQLEKAYCEAIIDRRRDAEALVTAFKAQDPARVEQASQKLQAAEAGANNLRKEALALIHQQNAAEGRAKQSDTNYVFLTFVINYLPAGLIGLLVAVIFCASMSSTASELNSLASTTVIDVYKRSIRPRASDQHYLLVSKLATVLWGGYAILLAEFANSLSNNLIEAVNLLGSLFYGTILGIFLVAFYVKRVNGHAVFAAAVVAETMVIALWKLTEVSYLWFNLIGCALVIGFSLLFSALRRRAAIA